MNKGYRLRLLDTKLKGLVAAFLLCLSVGYFTAISFVNYTTESRPAGIVDNYIGNEDDPEADVLKFKKSTYEMLNILHTHILSVSLIFFILALLVYATGLPDYIKHFLMIEPFVSIILTFGGIYMLWKGYLFLSFVVMLSGMLLTATFAVSVLAVFYEMTRKAD